MRKLGEQWIENGRMYKAVEGPKIVNGLMEGNTCHGCCYVDKWDDDCLNPQACPVGKGVIIKDLGILNEDGCLPCPFCGEYPESFNKGNEYTKKRGSVLKCNKCHYELTVCAIYQTIEWCKEKVLHNWSRRA